MKPHPLHYGPACGWMLILALVALISEAIPVSAITITDAEDEVFLPCETGVVVDGTSFGAVQGAGQVELGDNSNYALATKVSQTVNGWSDTQISIDVVPGGLTEGTLYLFATNDAGDTSVAYQVTVADRVSRVGAWTTGLTHTVGAGTDRLLVFSVGDEDNTDQGVDSVYYGGQSLTRIAGEVAGTTIFDRAELWYLDEAGITAATGNTFSLVWAVDAPDDPNYAAATYENVSQYVPVAFYDSVFTNVATPNPITITINVVQDGMAVASVTCGNTGGYTWNNGWTEGTDQGGLSSRKSTGDHAESADGTSTASATHTGPNRQVIVAAALVKAVGCDANSNPAIDPVAAQNLNEGGHLDVRVTASDPDAGDAMILVAENLPAHAAFADSLDGVGGITFDPDFAQSGSYQIRVIATDRGGLVDTELVDITVNDVIISVSADNTTFAFGTRPVNSWLPPDISLIVNDGNVAEDLSGQISQFTDGANNWLISAVANGANQIRGQWSATSETGPWTDIAAYGADFVIATNVPVSDTVTLWFRIQTPTSTNSYNAHSSTLTVTATKN